MYFKKFLVILEVILDNNTNIVIIIVITVDIETVDITVIIISLLTCRKHVLQILFKDLSTTI